jgi:hypothetical protein
MEKYSWARQATSDKKCGRIKIGFACQIAKTKIDTRLYIYYLMFHC